MIYDLIIIGGGCAGLSAAVYAARAGKSTLLFEKSVCGGQIINSPKVENYPAIPNISGYEFAYALMGQAQNFGCEFKFDEVLKVKTEGKIKKVLTAKNEYEALSVIVATGAYNRRLGLENEEKFIGKGVSYCATCDGAFFKGKTVAVVGGGNTALDDALYLSELCTKVYLVHRREGFRGNEGTLEKLKTKENVEILTFRKVSKLIGDERLKAVEISSTVEGDSTVETLEVNGIFIAVGTVPDTKNFTELVESDSSGYFESGENCLTQREGIFVAGDCRKKNVRQLATAASDGVVSALAAIAYISENKEV